MNVKYLVKCASSAFGAVSAVRALTKARHDGDRLRMADAVISAASAAIAVAIVVRDMRDEKNDSNRLVDLEENE